MNRFFLFFFFCVNMLLAQQTDIVDFKVCKAEIDFDTFQNKVYGQVIYDFKVLKNVDSIFIDAKNMRFRNSVRLIHNGMSQDNHYFGKVKYNYQGDKLWIINDFKKSKNYKLTFRYFANPKKAIYFIDWNNKKNVTSSDSLQTNYIEKKQIWTQGQGKYTSNWLPSIDDMNDKIEFDLSITFDSDYEVIANGNLTNKQINESTTTWHYDMQKPMSSYLVALAIGKYDKKVEYSKSGIPLEMYYYPEDSLKVEPTYRYTKQMFDFLEEEIGVPYPWQNYKQVPVKDFLYAGMENTSATIFADSFVIDSIAFIDKNYVNVNAHELAHQWFGDLVTETSGTHHWLQEGFATYYALLAERHVFGDDYYYWRLYEYAQELLEQDKAGQSTSLLNPKSSSITFYKKGAWVLHMLRKRVGDKAFKKGVKNYLLKHQYKNVETNDFISEVEKVSGEDLSEFVENWLESKKLPEEFNSLNFALGTDKYSEKSIYNYLGGFEFSPIQVGMLNLSSNESYTIEGVESIFDLFSSKPVEFNLISVKVLLEYVKKINLFSEKDKIFLLKKIFNSNDIKIRQAIAQSLSEIPIELKADYESLLNDESYITIETALFNLWKNFPEERKKYFDKTKDIQGFNDKNVRILWLALNLVSPDFEDKNIRNYYDELTDYTSPKYGFEIRQNAFQYLNQIQACNDVCKENLKQATKHHSWQFSKFAKTMLKVLEKK